MNTGFYELVQALSQEEWDMLHDLRRFELFVRREGVEYKTYHPDDYAHTNFPLVLKLNGKCIGTARLDLFAHGKAAIRLVAIAKSEQRKGHGRVLEQKFEELARSKGVEKLYVNSNPTAVRFYERIGFIYEQWDEPSGAPRSGISATSVQMAKVI